MNGTPAIHGALLDGAPIEGIRSAVFDEITGHLEAMVEKLAVAPVQRHTLGEVLDRVSWSLHATVHLTDVMATALDRAGAHLRVVAGRR